jgi:hypothetical protein
MNLGQNARIKTRNLLISFAFSLAISMIFAHMPVALATTTEGHIYHQLVDWPTGAVVGRLDYYTTVESSWSGSRHVIDDYWDAVSWWTWPLVYYSNVQHSVTATTGIHDEFAKGSCEFDCGMGIWTPWGYIPIQQYHRTLKLWVYASGYWTSAYY